MEKLFKQIADRIAELKERIIRLEKISRPTYTAGRILISGTDELPTTDSLLLYDASTGSLTTPQVAVGKGSGSSGNNTYLTVSRSADTGGYVTIDALLSGVGGTLLQLNKTYSGPVEIFTQAWQTPTLLNSWVNYGGGFNDAGYFKDPFGIVHLKGLIRNGTATGGTVLFTLPSGYRPVGMEIHSVASNSSFGEIRIATSGDITIVIGSNNWLSFDGITFRTT